MVRRFLAALWQWIYQKNINRQEWITGELCLNPVKQPVGLGGWTVEDPCEEEQQTSWSNTFTNVTLMTYSPKLPGEDWCSDYI